MLKVGQFIAELDALLLKQGFVPAPQQGNPMFDQVMQMVQQLPPEIQQQVMPQLQQVQQMPPDQQQPILQQIAQGLQQMMQQGGGQQGQPQPAQQQDPATQPQDPNAQTPQQDPNVAAAENNLDNTKVTLTVRELMDLTSGGKATSASLAVKQMMARHEQKMQAEQQKQQQAVAQSQQSSGQAAGPDLQGGGIYPTQ